MANAAFLAELDQWGPAALAGRATPSLEDSRAFCRRLATSHYENFPLVSCLLPPGLQQHFYNVYAWCRWADDLGDEVGDRDRSLDLLAWWEQELDDCYAGQSRHPVFVALAETIREFQIPREPFADLISAFVQDQSITEYLSFEQLRDYCRRMPTRSVESCCTSAAASARRNLPGRTASAPVCSSQTSGRTCRATFPSDGSTCRGTITSNSATGGKISIGGCRMRPSWN